MGAIVMYWFEFIDKNEPVVKVQTSGLVRSLFFDVITKIQLFRPNSERNRQIAAVFWKAVTTSLLMNWWKVKRKNTPRHFSDKSVLSPEKENRSLR